MKPTIFFDMDGVLADFVSAALYVHGKQLPYHETKWDFCSQIGFDGPEDPKFWEPMGFDFWRGLDPIEDGFKLLGVAEKLVGAENIGLLTSPSNNLGAVDGKLAWVDRYLPEYRPRTITCQSKGLIAGGYKVLIDDYDGNTESWAKGGGAAVTFPQPWNRLSAYVGHSQAPYLEWIVKGWEQCSDN